MIRNGSTARKGTYLWLCFCTLLGAVYLWTQQHISNWNKAREMRWPFNLTTLWLWTMAAPKETCSPTLMCRNRSHCTEILHPSKVSFAFKRYLWKPFRWWERHQTCILIVIQRESKVFLPKETSKNQLLKFRSTIHH